MVRNPISIFNWHTAFDAILNNSYVQHDVMTEVFTKEIDSTHDTLKSDIWVALEDRKITYRV